MSQLILRNFPLRSVRTLLPSISSSFCQSPRFYAQAQEKESKSLAEARERHEVSTDVRPLGEKIKENTKTASYMGIILLGVGVTAVMFFAIFRELFSSNSPNAIYSKTLDRVIHENKVKDSLGSPIKGFGEESCRGRRQHVAHSVYQRNGVNHMRMVFYVQGIRNKGTVQLEMREVNGNYEYRYLFVQLDHYPHTTIILEDNRANDPSALTAPDDFKLNSGSSL